MKKIFAIAAMMIMSVAAMNAQVNFGIKGGLNVSKMEFSSDVLESSNRCGFYIGPTVKFTLPIVGLGVDISALYNQRTSNLNLNNQASAASGLNGEKTVEHKSISIPLNARYQIVGLGDAASLFVYTGPQIDFTIGEKKILESYKDWTFKSSDFSWNVGVGAMVASHLQLNVNYNIGLSKTSEATNDAAGTALQVLGIKNSKENTWQVGLAYYF